MVVVRAVSSLRAQLWGQPAGGTCVRVPSLDWACRGQRHFCRGCEVEGDRDDVFKRWDVAWCILFV